MSATVSSVAAVVRNETSIRGWARMNSSNRGAKRWTIACVAAAARTRPAGECSPPATRSRSASASSSSRMACSSAACPAGESLTPRFARMNSGSPSSVSSDLIWWLTADWVSPSRSAARVKFSVSATTRNVRSCDSSIPPSAHDDGS